MSEQQPGPENLPASARTSLPESFSKPLTPEIREQQAFNRLKNALAKNSAHKDVTPLDRESKFRISREAGITRRMLEHKLSELCRLDPKYPAANKFLVGKLEVEVPESIDAQKQALGLSERDKVEPGILKTPTFQPLMVSINELGVSARLPTLDEHYARVKSGSDEPVLPDVSVAQPDGNGRKLASPEIIKATMEYMHETVRNDRGTALIKEDI